MNSENSPELRKELLDDFYAECDELLSVVRDNLALLERDLENEKPDPTVIESLFRNIHSLKGISAIVGLRPAEELAHAAEDVLRGLTKLDLTLSAPLIDTLVVAARRLEQIVKAHQLQKPLPDTRDVLESLRRRRPGTKRASAGRRNPDAIEVPDRAPPPISLQPTRDPETQQWICSFAPSAALDARGVNVNSVRERLGRIGEILRATPSVRKDGSILFEFLLALRQAPSDLAPWEADGLIFALSPADRKVDQPSAAPAVQEPRLLEALSLTPSHIVRVDLARLEDLMRITGDMVIHRFRLESRLIEYGHNQGPLKEINLALVRSLRELREGISRVRLVPIAEIFTRMPYVVRDLARESGKTARVLLEGNQTEIDKFLVERLKEPLLHLVRNAFSHGIESPTDRNNAGKPKEATIWLRASSEGESVVISVRDDGRGIDVPAIAARATSLGLQVPPRLELRDVLSILCTAGFSTREEADLASGRGVGMAVVAKTVRELGGTLAMESWPGKGTVFTLRLPLTLSIGAAFIVSVAEESCAIPQGSVDEIVQKNGSELRTIKQTEVVPYRGGLLPLVRLRDMFGIQRPPQAALTFLVLRSERGATGLVVDRVLGQREIVIRPLSDPLLRVPGISGATELGDGKPILILDPMAIAQGVLRPADVGDTSVVAGDNELNVS